ncbi:uncharacterized mitochondrial protein-like protein [Tanacetum coccineum]
MDYIKLLELVYVEDIIFGLTKKELCIAFEKLMHEKLQMSSMGELTFFLGLQVQQKKDGIFISQEKYVEEILKKFRFTKVKTVSTPMETQNPLLKDEDGEEVDVHMYRSMIGSLMYLTSLRPDIMFAVCACARYQVNPKVSHLHAVKRIFSDYAGASLDRKSTTGGCQFLGYRLILWQCKKQPIVVNSITEAEYIAALSCCGQLYLILLGKAKKSVKLMMEKLFIMELELMLVPQPSDPSENVADEAVHKELGDSLVRVGHAGESSGDEEDLGEDATKQGRRINAIDADKDITLVNVQDDADNEMFDVNVLNSEEVFVSRQNENVVEEVVDTAQVSTTATTVTITTKEITLAQALEALKTSKPKVKGIVFQETSTTTAITTIYSQQPRDKGKGIMIEEPVKPIKKKVQIMLDEEAALKLQAEFDEEERLAREKAKKEKEANIALLNMEAAKRIQSVGMEAVSLLRSTFLEDAVYVDLHVGREEGRIVGIKSLLDAVRITVVQVYVNTTLMKYCPPSKTAKQLEDILNFKQEGDETLYYAWERNIYSDNSNSDGIAAIVNKLDSLGRDMKKLKENVHAIQVGCQTCERAYLDKECPLNKEVKSVEGLSYGIDKSAPLVKRPSLEELMNKHLEVSTQRRAKMEEWVKKL